MQTNVQEFLWVAVPKASGAALQLVLNLFLLRELGPDQFGVLAVCFAAIILSEAVLGPAFDTAVLRQGPLYRDENEIRSLQIRQAGLVLKCGCAVVVAVPFLLFSRHFSSLLFQGRATNTLLYVCAGAILGLMSVRSIQSHFQVNRRFRWYGFTDIAINLGRYGGTALLLGFHAATPGRVLGLFAVAPAILAAVLLATTARPLLQVPFSTQACGELLSLVKSYFPTAAVGSVTSRMDLFFVTSLASVAQAGIFAAAQTLILAPQMIGMYLGVVFSPQVMPLWKAGKLRSPYLRFQRLSAIACTAAFLVALPTMGRFITAAMPASFHSATTVALILLPAGLMAFVNFPWTIAILLFLRPQFLLKFDLAALPFLAILYALACAKYGAAGAAAVTSLYALIKTAALQKMACHILRQPVEIPAGVTQLAESTL